MALLDPASNADRRKIAALGKDKLALVSRLAAAAAVLARIGGRMTNRQARQLILNKLYDTAHLELARYLTAKSGYLYKT